MSEPNETDLRKQRNEITELKIGDVVNVHDGWTGQRLNLTVTLVSLEMYFAADEDGHTYAIHHNAYWEKVNDTDS